MAKKKTPAVPKDPPQTQRQKFDHLLYRFMVARATFNAALRSLERAERGWDEVVAMRVAHTMLERLYTDLDLAILELR